MDTVCNVFFVSARVTPFKLTVVTDANEAVGATAVVQVANTNEASANAVNAAGTDFPLGTMGFSLIFSQQACPMVLGGK